MESGGLGAMAHLVAGPRAAMVPLPRVLSCKKKPVAKGLDVRLFFTPLCELGSVDFSPGCVVSISFVAGVSVFRKRRGGWWPQSADGPPWLAQLPAPGSAWTSGDGDRPQAELLASSLLSISQAEQFLVP